MEVELVDHSLKTIILKNLIAISFVYSTIFSYVNAEGLDELPADLQAAYAGADQPIDGGMLRDFKAKNSPPWTIGYASSYTGNTWRAASATMLAETLIPQAIEAGLVKEVITLQSDLNDQVQIQQMRQLVDQGVDAIFLCCSNPTALNQTVKYAYDKGVNFFDTAELYPVMPRKETYGKTEEIVGSWLKVRKRRDKIILASKIVSKSTGLDWIRKGSHNLGFDKKNMKEAIDASLKRLQTDYIDLYQLHWPERKIPLFGKLDFQYDPHDIEWTNIEEVLENLNELIKNGKIKYVGLSNETPWGAMKYLQIAKEKNLPRMLSIQNAYNLVNRVFDIANSEVSIREKCGLLAYSPLGFGALSGKYLNEQWPAKARLTLFKEFTRYLNPIAIKCTEEYVKIAKENNLSPAQMALAYINAKPFVTSNIIGATNLDQLKENIESIDINLDEKIIEKIEGIHKENPNPCP